MTLPGAFVALPRAFMRLTCDIHVLFRRPRRACWAIGSPVRAAVVLPWYSSATRTFLSNSRGRHDMSYAKNSIQKLTCLNHCITRILLPNILPPIETRIICYADPIPPGPEPSLTTLDVKFDTKRVHSAPLPELRVRSALELSP